MKAEVRVISQSRIRSDKGLMLETSVFESLYGGQFKLSTQFTLIIIIIIKNFNKYSQKGFSVPIYK